MGFHNTCDSYRTPKSSRICYRLLSFAEIAIYWQDLVTIFTLIYSITYAMNVYIQVPVVVFEEDRSFQPFK